MHPKKLFSSTLALAGTLISLNARAYNDTATHPDLTKIAVEKSALYTDPTLLFRLGLGSVSQLRFRYRSRADDSKIVTNQPTLYDLAAFVGEGAFDEDADKRAFNHFFDPHKNRPLTVGIKLGKRSWEWVLEPDEIPDQQRSIADARVFLRKALTENEGDAAQSEDSRGRAMANFFLCLGTASHHVQDMSQPQHVRNDQHLDTHAFFGLNPFFNPSRYERYTHDRRAFVNSKAQEASPAYPGPDAGNFKVARDFWFNDSQSGIAQVTNSNFVTQGTNFTISLFGDEINVGTYPLPTPGPFHDYEPDDDELFGPSGVPEQIRSLCAQFGVPCTMTMYAAGPLQKASTLSIFDQDLVAAGVEVSYPAGDIVPDAYQTHRFFSLNNFNYAEAHQVLIGKAVGYTAGFINHFFRGRLEVEPPGQGPYAAADQSAGEGFAKVRARITNATPGEALTGGSLTAVARFHRNRCYKPDLSGEFQQDEGGQIITPCPEFRSSEEHIRVAEKHTLDFADGEARELTFTFADPIPFDATDLVLQVLYEGRVGDEQASFALGAADVSEPTFATVMNGTDVFELPTAAGGQFFYYPDIINNVLVSPFSIVDIDQNGLYATPPDVNVFGGNIAYDVIVDDRPVGSTAALPEGRFARLALLVKPAGYTYRLRAFGAGLNEDATFQHSAKIGQLDPETGTFFISPVVKLRNQALQFNSVVLYRFFISATADIGSMPPSKADQAETPIPVFVGGALQNGPSGQRAAAPRRGPDGASQRRNAQDSPRALSLDAPPVQKVLAPAVRNE